MNRIRENWIDNIKVFACILVVLGHFYQSMCSSGIVSESPFYQWFDQTIYYFHVPLFFICSGYIFQKYTAVKSFADWKKHAIKKLLTLGVPYFVFSSITWGLKNVFSDSVNSEAHELWYDLFVHPLSPYWYLFALFFIFLMTPTFLKPRSCLIGLSISFLLKVAASFTGCLR